MLSVSLTFDWGTVRRVVTRPGVQVLATGLVDGPMSVAGHLLGAGLFARGPLALGFTLVVTVLVRVDARSTLSDPR